MQSAPSTAPKSKRGLIIGCSVGCLGLLVTCCATGGLVAYEDNKPIDNWDASHELDVPVTPGTPTSITVTNGGPGWAFENIWLDVHATSPTGQMTVDGAEDCGSGGSYPSPISIEVSPTAYEVKHYEPEGAGFHAIVKVADVYFRPGTRTCTVAIASSNATITGAAIYVTERRRPSDIVAN